MKKIFSIITLLLLASFFIGVAFITFKPKTSVVFKNTVKERLELENVVNEKIGKDTEVVSVLDKQKSYFVGVPVYEKGSKNIKDVNVVLSVDLSKWPIDVEEISKTIPLDIEDKDTVKHYNNLGLFFKHINGIDVKSIINPLVESIIYI